MIDRKIDTGEILLSETVDIPEEWTAGDLHDHLMEKGAELVLRTVQGLAQGALAPSPQDDSLSIHPHPKFSRRLSHHWNQPTETASITLSEGSRLTLPPGRP